MSVLPSVVSFANKQGHRLFGVVHRPEAAQANGTAILLLSPGVKMRVAPHRLYQKMAEQFVTLGFTVLRFDFHGLGDSEGEVREELLANLYGTIQTGRYVDDTVAAMDWMQQTYGTTQFIASGLCGGAITGLLAAERDARITALLGLAIPVIIEGSQIDSAKHMTRGQLDAIRGGYLGRLLPLRADAWRSWVRFFTFQSDYRLLVRSLLSPLTARLRRPTQSAAPASSEPAEPDNVNPLFAPAFFRMLSTRRPMLLIFAGSDRLYWEFEAKFVSRYGEQLSKYSDLYRVHVTPLANHIFSLPEWQHDMLDQCKAWLKSLSQEEPARLAARR